MKKGKIIWMAVIAALILVPTMSWAQAKTTKPISPRVLEPSFMIEIYTGGGSGTSTNSIFRDFRANSFDPSLRANVRAGLDAYVMGGMKFGYWFNPNGTYGIAALPEWMKYFGFYTDISYHKLSYGNSRGSWNAPLTGNFGHVGFNSDGSLVSWAFMFAGRLGFMPDNEVPFGRLQPYVAVGPAIFFSHQDPTFNLRFHNRVGAYGFSPAGQGSINVGLAVETGIRYFFNKSISMEASFKYRYFTPRYDYVGHTNGFLGTVPYSVTAKPNYNLYSGQVGVAYHF